MSHIKKQHFKHHFMSLSAKNKFLKDYESGKYIGKTQKVIAAELKITPRTLRTMFNKKDEIYKLVNVRGNAQRSYTQKSTYPDLEKVVVQFIIDSRQRHIPLTSKIICRKAIRVSEKMKIENFKASDCWFRRFKKAHKANTSTTA